MVQHRFGWVSLSAASTDPYAKAGDEFKLTQFGKKVNAAAGVQTGVALLTDYNPLARPDFVALIKALQPQHGVSLIHNTDPNSDPFSPTGATAATQRLLYGLTVAAELGLKNSGGPVQPWMHRIKEPGPVGPARTAEVNCAAKAIAEALLQLGPSTSVKTFDVEPLNWREVQWHWPGVLGVGLVRKIRDHVGSRGPLATLLVDTSHTAEMYRTVEEVRAWLKPAAEEGLVGTLHVSAPISRGSVVGKSAPWGQLTLDVQIDLWKELGLLTTARDIAVEIFDWEDAFLRDALALWPTYPSGGIINALTAGFRHTRTLIEGTPAA